MKKIINILLALVLILVFAFSLVACGDTDGNDGRKGLLVKKYSGEDFYTVYGYVDEGKNVTSLDIGALAGEKIIGRIAKNAFSGNDTLEEVIVPDTVTEIAEGAFQKMKKLSKITLPFVGKTAVSDSYMHETDEADDKAVDGERIFAFIFGTEEYAYGEAITVNYGSATATYYIPTSLKEITIKPAGEYKIPMYAFAGTVLIEKINLFGNITSIGKYAFQGCRDLSSINIPASVTTIDNYAFEGCSYLAKGLVFDQGSTLSKINGYAFANSGIQELTLPSTVTEIGNRAFKGSAIEKIVLSASLTKVSSYAFYNCKELRVVDISAVSGAPELGVSAFEDCENLVFTAELDAVWSVKGANYKANTKGN